MTSTEEERLCKEHFVATFVQDITGRCELCLPYQRDVGLLGPSRDAAHIRFLQLERRLDMNPVIKARYVAFKKEYEKLGHMSVVPEDQLELLPAAMYYLPHHAVMKEGSTTTKLRVVFDASAKSASVLALNDQLMIGPKLQDDLFGLVVRFCTHRVAISADIEKMYRQINVNHEDVNFQRILWRESSDLSIQDFQLNTITYGMASAPFQVVRCLQEASGQNCLRWPQAAVVTITDFYMDDLMSGAQFQELALALQKQLILLMEDGDFCLRKWVSNEPAILECVNETLQVLSAIGRVYDPLGWLACGEHGQSSRLCLPRHFGKGAT